MGWKISLACIHETTKYTKEKLDSSLIFFPPSNSFPAGDRFDAGHAHHVAEGDAAHVPELRAGAEPEAPHPDGGLGGRDREGAGMYRPAHRIRRGPRQTLPGTQNQAGSGGTRDLDLGSYR